jgi:uncharacterized membrane protein
MNSIGERFPGEFFWREAHDVSDDGAVIVGQQAIDGNDDAFVWTEESGVVSLKGLFVDKFGLSDPVAEWQLISATGVSADGKTIVGMGRNPEANAKAGSQLFLNLKRTSCSSVAHY